MGRKQKAIRWILGLLLTSIVLVAWNFRSKIVSFVEAFFVEFLPFILAIGTLIVLTTSIIALWYVIRLGKRLPTPSTPTPVGPPALVARRRRSTVRFVRLILIIKLRRYMARRKSGSTRPRGLLIKVLVALVLVGLYFGARSIVSSFKPETKDQAQTAASKSSVATTAKAAEEKVPTSRIVVGVVILLAVGTILVVSARSSWEPNKKLYQQKFWRHPVGIAIYVLIAGHLLIYFLLPRLWYFMWSDQILFWSLNIGIIILVGLRVMVGADNKPLPAAQKGAFAFGLIFAVGLLAQIGRNPYWERLGWDWSGKSDAARNIPNRTQTDFSGVPAEIALPIICGCESNGGIPPGRQFEDDGITPLKNRPKPGEKPSSAIGMCQILADKHEKRAKEEFSLDIRTQHGNWEYAKILYNESTPHTKHWEGTPGNTTKGCWEPRLAALGYGQGTGRVPILLGTVDVPVDRWSAEVPNPSLSRIRWGRLDLDKGGSCEVMMDKDPQKIFPMAGEYPRITPRVVQFKCSEEGAQISVKAL